MPLVKVEIDRMRHTIVTQLGLMHSELGEALSAEIERAVAEYDWQAHTRRIVNEVLDKCVSDYFSIGPGFDLISSTVEKAFNSIFDATERENEK